MRIINGRDYYDTVQYSGLDDTLTFAREKNRAIADNLFFRYKEELERPFHIKLLDGKSGKPVPFDGYNSGLYELRHRRFTLSGPTVIFCGTIHRGVKADVFDQANTLVESSVHWTGEGFAKWLDRAGLTLEKIQTQY